MAHRLKTPAGRSLYALPKQTPEPVFGIIKSALGFHQFSLRGLAATLRGDLGAILEWTAQKANTPGRDGSGVSVSVVAGARIGRDRHSLQVAI